MNRLTDIEAGCLDLLEDINSFLTTKPKTLEFMGMMGRIRDMRKKLLYKSYGCPDGKHLPEYCKCEREIV